MTKAVFNRIKSVYGMYSSFAIWNENDIDDLELIEKNITRLHGRVIFVAYNASAQINKFQNFHFSHRGGRDAWLAKSIGGQSHLQGSYMTDFFKGDFAKREFDVVINKSIIEKNWRILKEEISVLDEKEPVIVAIGRKAERVIKDCGMKCKYLPHYAGRISRKNFEQRVEELNNLLR